MRRHLLILGPGFGGMKLATRLCETIPDAVRVTLLDRSATLHFGYSELDATPDAPGTQRRERPEPVRPSGPAGASRPSASPSR